MILVVQIAGTVFICLVVIGIVRRFARADSEEEVLATRSGREEVVTPNTVSSKQHSSIACSDLYDLQAVRYRILGMAGVMITITPDYTKPGQKCPFVEVGDVLLGQNSFFVVKEMKFNQNCAGVCKGSNRLMLIHGSDGNAYNPGNLVGIQCKRCPLIADKERQSRYAELEKRHPKKLKA